MVARRTGNEASGAPRALVVGDLMLDRYVIGNASRLSPEAPVPVVVASQHDVRPGGAANVAAGIAAQGVETTLLGVTGEDESSEQIGALVAKYGVDYQPLRFTHLRTTEKVRVVSGPQQIVRIDYETQVDSAALDALMDEYLRILPDFSAVVFSDYAKGVLRRLPEMLAAARERGIPTFVDPKVPDPEHYRGAFLIKPNAREFAGLLGEDGDLTELAQHGLRTYGWDNIVVTRSAEGMVHACNQGSVRHYTAETFEVFDVSGAGDTVLATLTAAYLKGHPLADAIDIANRAAAVAVSHAGTYVVTQADLAAHISGTEAVSGKIRTLDGVVLKLAQAKFNNTQVVFTNGCFDILHAGHVRVLAEARRQGDLLVVGLNSDESIARLKGPTRPVNSYDDRAEVLAGLESVDFVVRFDDDTPIRLIEEIQPDIIVKGGDYDPDTIVGADVVRAKGGKVVIVPLLAGRSTTSIIDRARQN